MNRLYSYNKLDYVKLVTNFPFQCNEFINLDINSIVNLKFFFESTRLYFINKIREIELFLFT